MRSLRTKGKRRLAGRKKGFSCHLPDCCPTALSKGLVEIFTCPHLWMGLAIGLQLRAETLSETDRAFNVSKALDIFLLKVRPWKHGGASPNKGLEPSTAQFDRVRGLWITLQDPSQECSGVHGQGSTWRNFDYLF
jgi:hypothetical protein